MTAEQQLPDTRRDDALSAGAVLVILLSFAITSGNARWMFWAGLWPSLVIPPFLMLLSGREPLSSVQIPSGSVLLLLCLTGMALIAGASAFMVDPSQLSIVQWVGSYVSPLFVYLGLLATPFNSRLFRAVWTAITVGALIPLLAGIAAYYSEWGIPSGLDLLISRYDTERMAGYMEATFGNTGNTAAYLALLIPPWFAFLISRSASGGARLLYAVALLVALAHVLIVESRTLLIVLIVVLPLVAYFYRVRFAAAAGGLLIAIGALLLPLISAGDRLLELSFGALEGTSDDQSVSERSEAMRIGLRLMIDSPGLGVGPGNSSKVHIYTSAHQYWINQGAEIGFLGFLLSALLSVIVFWRFLAFLRVRSNGSVPDRRFAGIAGGAAYMLYGTLANMPLSSTVVNAWVGLFAITLALADVRLSYAPQDRSVPTP